MVILLHMWNPELFCRSQPLHVSNAFIKSGEICFQVTAIQVNGIQRRLGSVFDELLLRYYHSNCKIQQYSERKTKKKSMNSITLQEWLSVFHLCWPVSESAALRAAAMLITGGAEIAPVVLCFVLLWCESAQNDFRCYFTEMIHSLEDRECA